MGVSWTNVPDERTDAEKALDAMADDNDSFIDSISAELYKWKYLAVPIAVTENV
tara:strand:- start:14544 stop:14705 length:162 start_codon:yes stop_codon:yes gene_type:complete